MLGERGIHYYREAGSSGGHVNAHFQPPCPLGENVLDAREDSFQPFVARVTTKVGEVAYQVDRLVNCRAIIRKEILGRKTGKRHVGNCDWRKIVDEAIDQPIPDTQPEKELEERARLEKAAALAQLFQSRLSVLIGPAGTGKTTLLRMLSSLPEVKNGGLLLLAPTGKARVRLEEQTDLRGSGYTIAQFLIGHQRYDGATGAYFPNRKAPRCSQYRNVIIDECSMLTEEQLAALIDSLSNVERLVLVGDPGQLPPHRRRQTICRHSERTSSNKHRNCLPKLWSRVRSANCNKTPTG